MPLRITTWNVNGIRNPFGYQPWRDRRSFDAMFDILEADIVVMQELKIQRKDLRDDMVLVPGWDCYFSLPKHKKGYSGVAIYTRQSACAPIRAEEGILGVLCSPGSSTAYRDLGSDRSIGGYPTDEQIAQAGVDPATLDAEGRCVVLEFPAFVIFGVYSPANSNGLRDDFRYGFLNALDSRIRNLVAQGKRVVLTGDLNVSREEIDTASAEDNMKKEGISHEEYISTPNRRIFNQLLEGGPVVEPRDEGREQPVLWDTCRGFHPTRKGMYTHWEQKINARPGNFGSRIDYVLCSIAMKDWVSNADIQEGLMGSDHCPVYAVLKDRVVVDGEEADLQDIMNPPGTFEQGKRVREWSLKDVPALSGKLLPDFDRRRSIKDMFARRPSARGSASGNVDSGNGVDAVDHTPPPPAPSTQTLDNGSDTRAEAKGRQPIQSPSKSRPDRDPPVRKSPEKKRLAPGPAATNSSKRKKANAPGATVSNGKKGQQSLAGFFKPSSSLARADSMRSLQSAEIVEESLTPLSQQTNATEASVGFPASAEQLQSSPATLRKASRSDGGSGETSDRRDPNATSSFMTPRKVDSPEKQADAAFPTIVDPIVSKESWSKLFKKRDPPCCEDHDELCIMLTTKKPGINYGRAFWICPRPVGPTGTKEKNTQWRCHTFIWASDWKSSAPD